MSSCSSELEAGGDRDGIEICHIILGGKDPWPAGLAPEDNRNTLYR